MRTELIGNLKKEIGALASSIVLVCRPRDADAPTVTRREFVNTLKSQLPVALAHLQRGNIARPPGRDLRARPSTDPKTRRDECLAKSGGG